MRWRDFLPVRTRLAGKFSQREKTVTCARAAISNHCTVCERHWETAALTELTPKWIEVELIFPEYLVWMELNRPFPHWVAGWSRAFVLGMIKSRVNVRHLSWRGDLVSPQVWSREKSFKLSLQTPTEWDCMHLINNLFPEGVVMAEDIKKLKQLPHPPNN